MAALNECRSEVVRMISKGEISSEILDLLHEDSALIPHETELWDYKEQLGSEKLDLAELARDVISFHNSFGGYLIIGVADDGTLHGAAEISSTQVKQVVKNYSGVDIAVATAQVHWKSLEFCLIYIPKRALASSPCAISRQGPEYTKGKVLFKPGDIFFRSDESSQLIRDSADLRFLIGERQHADDRRGMAKPSRVVSNNLPDRSVVFSRFFGRKDLKESLWNWLADPFSKYRVVAGAGGIGKTSAVYSFCEEVCAEAPLALEQVVWISAKVRQFDAIQDRAVLLPYHDGARQYGQSFRDFESLLDAISYHLAINDEEWEGCGVHAKKKQIIDALSFFRSLIIVDDLDSLEPDDQRTAVEFAMSLIGGESRVVFTTRKNYLAPSASTDEILGLDDVAFDEYIDYLQAIHKRTLSKSEIRDLKRDTAASPLFMESVFRMLKLGQKFGDALSRWKGRDGEAVRAACFQREVDQISFSAKRALYSLSQFESASIAEIKRVAEMATHEIESAIQELSGLFLIQSKEVAGEPRFSVSSSLRLMIEDIKEKIPNHNEILRRSRDLKKDSKAGVSRDRDRSVADAIQQAMAHLAQSVPSKASRTIEIALRNNPKSADLHMVHARCLSRCEPPDVARVRSAFQKSFDLGKKEPQLFFKWLDFEVEIGNANAAIDVASKAAGIIRDDDWRWLELRSKAHSKRATERASRREWTDSMTDWDKSQVCIQKSIKVAPSPAKSQLISVAQFVNDSKWKTINSGDSFPLDLKFKEGLDIIRKGDRRDLCVHRVLDVIEEGVNLIAKGWQDADRVSHWIIDLERCCSGRISGRIESRIRDLKARLTNVL
ncbi:AlbA family DNA-binding domain-containing protein [Xanthomonas arboricola]|uniref:AlbA family DNA-binding domain-containing protein n=1 Tax=Xanthomonas arboricola TaxID=56448 RepID=UPI003EBE3936